MCTSRKQLYYESLQLLSMVYRDTDSNGTTFPLEAFKNHQSLSFYSDEMTKKEEKDKRKIETCLTSTEGAPKRKRRNRSHFTQRQLQYLEKIFSRQQYLTRDERTLLARGLEMTELQIRNWFQNQRYQKKHRANENKKQEKPESPVCVKPNLEQL